jgi:DNA-directed RNA polymerase I, II, and III subunit RPABC5
MIIPVRCFTCNKVIASKWETYVKLVREADIKKVKVNQNDLYEKSNKGVILDNLGLKRICCRRHFLGHVELL